MQTITAADLVLEPLTVAHAPEMFEVLCDPLTHQYIDHPPPSSVDHLRAVYKQLETRKSPDGRQLWLNWVVRLPGQPAMGYVQATQGRVEWDGRDMTGAAPERMARAGLGYVPEGRAIFPNLSVRENLLMAARPGAWTLERVLANLLSNAVKFSDPGGRVEIVCGTTDRPTGSLTSADVERWTTVTVRDTGEMSSTNLGLPSGAGVPIRRPLRCPTVNPYVPSCEPTFVPEASTMSPGAEPSSRRRKSGVLPSATKQMSWLSGLSATASPRRSASARTSDLSVSPSGNNACKS